MFRGVGGAAVSARGGDGDVTSPTVLERGMAEAMMAPTAVQAGWSAEDTDDLPEPPESGSQFSTPCKAPEQQPAVIHIQVHRRFQQSNSSCTRPKN